MGQKVFICHSSADKTLAEQVCADLEAQGLNCWIAPRDVTPGAQWAAELAGAIDDCGVFLLIFTAHSNSSSQVLREVERAVRREKVIVNYRSDEVACSSALDYYLAVHQWFDPTGSVDDDMRRLAVHLQRVCGADRKAAAAARPAPAPPREASAAAASFRPASPPRSAPAAAPRASAPSGAALVTFDVEAPWMMKIPVLGDFYRWVSGMPGLKSMATLAIDQVVVQHMPALLPFSMQQPMALGDHQFELSVKLGGARRYPLRLSEPGQYTIHVGRSRLTNNFAKTYQLAFNGSPQTPVQGNARFSVVQAILVCFAAFWLVGFIMALIRTAG